MDNLFRFIAHYDSQRPNLSGDLTEAWFAATLISLQDRTPQTMFISFFHELKAAKVPVTLKEYLTLMEAIDRDLAEQRVEDFYYLSRAALVKDERYLDRFDRVFGHVFKGLDLVADGMEADIPEDWLRRLAERYLSDAEKAEIEALEGQGGAEITVENHPLCIAPGYPAVTAKSKKLSYQDHGLNWDISEKNGFFSPFAYQGD